MGLIGEISDLAGKTPEETMTMMRKLANLGYVDADLKFTDKGQKALSLIKEGFEVNLIKGYYMGYTGPGFGLSRKEFRRIDDDSKYDGDL